MMKDDFYSKWGDQQAREMVEAYADETHYLDAYNEAAEYVDAPLLTDYDTQAPKTLQQYFDLMEDEIGITAGRAALIDCLADAFSGQEFAKINNKAEELKADFEEFCNGR